MIFFYLITFIIGFLITKSFLKETENKFLIFSFSVAFGIAIESFLMFILMMLNMNNYIIFLIAEIVLILIAVLISIRQKIEFFPKNKDKNNDKDKNKFLNVVFIIALLIGLIHIFYTIKMEPYGTWDAHYMWNFRPKFFIALEDIGENWKIFFKNISFWTHPDYPMLIPVYNYKNHILNGGYTPLLNAGTAILIFSAVLSGVYGLINEISSRKNALLAVVILLTTDCFIYWAVSQCADVPLSLFILTAIAAISLFVKYKNNAYIFFAYYFAASATFCKNEGLMFFLIFTIISLLLIKNQNKKMIICGALLPFICVFLHKSLLFLTCDLFENQTLDLFISRLFSLERYKTILYLVTKHIIENFLTLIILFGVICFSGFTNNNKVKTLGKMYILIFIFAMLGYFAIYLITPRELEWHINTTDLRLIVQYLPVFIIYCFTAFNCANKKTASLNIEDKDNLQ